MNTGNCAAPMRQVIDFDWIIEDVQFFLDCVYASKKNKAVDVKSPIAAMAAIGLFCCSIS